MSREDADGLSEPILKAIFIFVSWVELSMFNLALTAFGISSIMQLSLL